MAQTYSSLKASSLIKNDRQTINDNFDAVRSCHSGTAYPTAELVAGMLFFNTSTKKFYEYNGSAWVQLFDLSSGTAVVPKAVVAESSGKATGDKNGKDITGYVAKLEQDSNNAFVIRVYNGANNVMTTITIPETEVNVMTGASTSSAGKAGLVPAPSAGDNEKFLCGDGSFKEAGKVKSVNGQTGDVVVDLPVGHTYFSFEKEVPVGRLPAFGALYNRNLYADLWAYAQERNLVVSESEWQAIASANDGNCVYYSSGDGSTTFRVPKLPTTIASDVPSEVPVVGNGMTLGLLGDFGMSADSQANIYGNLNAYGTSAGLTDPTGTTLKSKTVGITTDSTKSGIVAKMSATKTTGQWLIVAFGVAHNIGEADVANVMQAVEQVQTGLTATDNKITGIIDYIVESYRNGTEWYEVYKSGKVRQGGRIKSGTTTYLKPFKDTSYTITSNLGSNSTNGFLASYYPYQKNATNFVCNYDTHAVRDWVAEGQGA